MACRGVEGVKGVKGESARPLRGGLSGLALLKGVDLPRTQDPGSRAGLEILVATFLAISLLFFFASFFDAFLGRFWVDFRPQLASQNPVKSLKNRCQDAFPC